jgi:hypothetical protein
MALRGASIGARDRRGEWRTALGYGFFLFIWDI